MRGARAAARTVSVPLTAAIAWLPSVGRIIRLQRDGAMRRLPVMCLLVTLTLGLAPGSAHAGTSCHTIQATGVGSGAPPQPGDPANLVRTQARLSDAGLLQGTTQAAFTIVAPTPVGFAFVGDLVVSTNRATLTLALTGTLDVSTGDFTATGPVVAATGKVSPGRQAS